MDGGSVLVTLAGDEAHLPADVAGRGPRPLMAWTAKLWGGLFEPLGRGYRLAEHGERECGWKGWRRRATKTTCPSPPPSHNPHTQPNSHTDYALGDRKFGGNAQALSRGRWLHHTSMLWNYRKDRMALLKSPPRAPAYRERRNHDEFVVGLETVLRDRSTLIEGLEACVRTAGFDLIPTSVEEALALVEGDHHKSTVLV